MTGGRSLLRHLALAGILAALVAVVLGATASWPATLEALRRFRWRLGPLVLLAVLGNYGLRFAKWHYYLRRLAIPLPWRPSVLVFLAGLTMSITPGKLGEVLKAVLVRHLTGTEVSRTASAVVAERLTDVAGLLLLAALGVTALPHGPVLLGLVGTVLVGAVVVLRVPVLGRGVRVLFRGRLLQDRLLAPARQFLAGARALLAPAALLLAVALSIVSWFLECAALWLILQGLDAPTALRTATFSYAFASLAGAVSMLPGGLGVAEASLAGLLAGTGTALPAAAAATLLVRALTLWLAVLLGTTTLLLAFRGGPRSPADR